MAFCTFGYCFNNRDLLSGVMIHHKLMNDAAFDFLELLLKFVVNRKNFLPVHFKDLAEAEVY